MTISDDYTEATKILGEGPEERLAQPEDSLARIKAALAARGKELPRLPCGCIDLPVVRLQYPGLVSSEALNRALDHTLSCYHGKTPEQLLDSYCYGSRWEHFKEWLKLVRTNVGILFGHLPRS